MVPELTIENVYQFETCYKPLLAVRQKVGNQLEKVLGSLLGFAVASNQPGVALGLLQAGHHPFVAPVCYEE